MDRGEWEVCYRKHASSLVRFAASVVGPVDAEDVVASVMVALMGSERRVDDVAPYLYRSVLNECRKQRRSMERRRRRDVVAAGLDRYEHAEYVPEVAAALGRLSPQQRTVVHLTYWEDLAPAPVAVRLGVRDGTVRRQLARARRRLAEVFDDAS